MEKPINFDIQYSASYRTRFAIMRKLILENPILNEYNLQVKELSGNLNQECVIIATLFLASAFKHSVLNDNEETTRILKTTYMSDDAILFIEDESGKIEIQFREGFSKLQAFTSGMVLGYVGEINEKNIFWCKDIIFPKPLDHNENNVRKGRVLFISNCLFKNGNSERLKIITDIYKNKIDEVLIIGDTFIEGETNPDFRVLNKWIDNCGLHVSIIPGLNDPTTQLIPQAPLHELLFTQRACRKDGTGYLKLLPNPCQIKMLSFDLAILSHHILHDIAKYVPQHKRGVQSTPADYSMHADEAELKNFTPKSHFDDDSILSILEQLVRIRYLAPNAPDTIGCIPYDGNDPFVLNACDYIISGGFSKPSKKIYNRKVLLGVPDFDKTVIAMLLDFSTGDFEEIKCERF